jgi:hypothetical protein
MEFLKSLSELERNNLESPEKQQQERTAASVLFDWEVLIWQFFVVILVNCRISPWGNINASVHASYLECRIAKPHKLQCCTMR